MHNKRLLTGVSAFALLTAPALSAAAASSNKACQLKTTGIHIDQACGGLMEPLPQVSCYMPSDVEGGLQQKNLNIVQRATDIFSWQAFIALNWPVKPKKVVTWPGGIVLPIKPKEVVWQTWKPLHEVFLENGQTPPSWETTPKTSISACGQDKPMPMLVDSLPDVHNRIAADLQAAVSDASLPATLTDQDGHLTRYDIRINQQMFDYIVKNQFYKAEVQKAAQSVSFPNGSIVIKAAWREVNNSNDARFYTTEACVCEGYEGTQPIGCKPKQMGLVGMHIVTKTPSAPQWIWSTYEQVDNVAIKYPNIRTPETGIVKPVSPSYYDPSCKKDCPPNKQTPKGVPAQLTRLIPVPSLAPNCSQENQAVDDIKQLNLEVQKALADTNRPKPPKEIDRVFQYYELVNTQWAVHKADDYQDSKTDIKAAIPPIVANLTMESYVQQTSTCIGCHSTARTINPEQFVSSDFTFVLSHNQVMPKLESECYIDPPLKPEMTGKYRQWELDNWESIIRGSQLLENTYEELPYFTTAKLHCTSCHLKGGSDSNAAWWVPMVEKYRYPETQNLQARVNRCFQRSMNGYALCAANTGQDTADNCKYDDNMTAIVTYMQWLNKKAQAAGIYHNPNCQKPDGSIKDGFPSFPKADLADLRSNRNPVQGQSIYVQKCAVCHAVDGQGRYEHDNYHRPAVWGPDSFNFTAGIAGTQKMAEFLKGNMPLDAGGMLTDQEAWDLASFLNECQCRPGRNLTTDGKACELSPNCPSAK